MRLLPPRTFPKHCWNYLCAGALLVAVVWPQFAHSLEENGTKEPTAVAKKNQDKPTFNKHIRPLLQKYCYECHGPQKQRGEIALHKYKDETAVIKDRDLWERALEALTTQTMPPENRPQPTANERQLIVEWLEATLFHIDCDAEAQRDPGRVTIRRLNRTEYNNTIRDLVGVNFKPADDFPSDDVGYGFDNIGDVLSLPPLLLEKYLDAAEKITDAAITNNPVTEPPKQRSSWDQLQKAGDIQLYRDGALLINSAGEVFAQFEFPHTGEYILRARASAQQAGDESAKMEFRIDGKAVDEFEVKATANQNQRYERHLKIEKGTHKFSAAFINDFRDEQAADESKRDRNLIVGYLEVEGPLDLALLLPETHKRLIVVRPGGDRQTKQAARENLAKFVNRAFRRPATDNELDRFANLADTVVRRGNTFEKGMQVSLQAILVSPQFLFRLEKDAAPNDPQARHAVADYELASRLSYFLWSSMPDEELFALAAQGELHKQPVLEAQTRRMLKDPKAKALVENFAEQWLQLRILDEVSPDPAKFPTVNEQLKADMARETEMFCDAVIREDRSLGDFLDGRFTFVNERLAKHYNIAGVTGDQFRRVELKDVPRAGILTQASILTLTSNPTRTSPVKRGKWIMETILGTPPPPPPMDVPELEQTAKAAPNASLREQLEIHRKNESCAVCHRQMDALGFGFENFDAVGRWRDRDGKFAIDPSGTLPGGETFQGPAELIAILKKRRADFSRSLTEKLLTYALGRGLEFYDRCTVDTIVKTLTEKDDRFSTLVLQIVTSEPFRMRRGEGEKE